MPAAPEGYRQPPASHRGRKRGPSSLMNSHTSQTAAKPQLRFEERADNSNDTPWIPKLVEKYHARRAWSPPSNELNGMSAALTEHVKSLGVGSGPYVVGLHHHEDP